MIVDALERTGSAWLRDRPWIGGAIVATLACGCAHGGASHPAAHRPRTFEGAANGEATRAETSSLRTACFEGEPALDLRAPPPRGVALALRDAPSCPPPGESASFSCRFAEARALFVARRYERAGPRLLELAEVAPQGEAAEVALLALESAIRLADFATPPRLVCLDLVASELPRLTARHCAAEGTEGAEPACAELRRMERDLNARRGCALPAEPRPSGR